jgi:hypothetical protein
MTSPPPEKSPTPVPSPPSEALATPLARVLAAWALVGTPLLWGVFQTLKKAWALFQ